jgi:hypothetical protein
MRPAFTSAKKGEINYREDLTRCVFVEPTYSWIS